ncbi:kinase-like domain-containing protein [Rhizophagus irregularis DAOM 181602=DAOM 197198]|nr:kinase-like domain-containing protein [Rhizophagus irregularis DAOM 181602=DAOM 197198]
MIEHIENLLNSRYGKQIFYQVFGLCPVCNQPKTSYHWCKICNSIRFQNDFNKWTSGNEIVDKFIQNAQSKARNRQEVIEWIPYEKLSDIQYLDKGGFSTIFKAIWLVGGIEKWNNKIQQWERYAFTRVVLKSLNNSSNVNKDFLNEVNDNITIIFYT